MWQSWDLSVDSTARAADTAGGVYGKRGQGKFLLDLDAQPMDFLAQIDAIGAMIQKWPRSASLVLIEAKGNGAALVRAKGSEWTGLTPVQLPTHSGGQEKSKDARMNECKVQFRSGLVHFPHPDIAPWVMMVVKQICGSSRKRDVADQLSQGLCNPAVNEDEFCVV
jgi:phage terminase large subunit-like protein